MIALYLGYFLSWSLMAYWGWRLGDGRGSLRALLRAWLLDEPNSDPDGIAYWRAATDGDLGEVERQINLGVPIEAKNPRDQTALILACEHGNLEVVEFLLASGATADRLDVFGEHTALITAASFGHLGIVKALVGAGASVDLTNRFGRTALQAASAHGHEDVATWLAQRCAPPEAYTPPE